MVSSTRETSPPLQNKYASLVIKKTTKAQDSGGKSWALSGRVMSSQDKEGQDNQKNSDEQEHGSFRWTKIPAHVRRVRDGRGYADPWPCPSGIRQPDQLCVMGHR